MENKDNTLEGLFAQAKQIEIRIIRSLDDGSGMVSPYVSVLALAMASASLIAITAENGKEEDSMDRFCEIARTWLHQHLEEAREYKKDQRYGKEQMD